MKAFNSENCSALESASLTKVALLLSPFTSRVDRLVISGYAGVAIMVFSLSTTTGSEPGSGDFEQAVKTSTGTSKICHALTIFSLSESLYMK